MSRSDRGQQAHMSAGDEFDRRIDEALCSRFAPPPVRSVAVIASSIERPAVIASPWRRRAAILAVACIAASAAATYWRDLLPWGSNNTTSTVESGPECWIDDVYEGRLEAGFNADWVCKSDAEFADVFNTRLGERVHLAKLPEGAQLVGLAYQSAMSDFSTMVLVRSGEDRIMVVVDRLSTEHRAPPPNVCWFHVQRRVVGDLVMYEFTPRTTATVLPLLSVDDRP